MIQGAFQKMKKKRSSHLTTIKAPLFIPNKIALITDPQYNVTSILVKVTSLALNN
jgi:hypothetical protein